MRSVSALNKFLNNYGSYFTVKTAKLLVFINPDSILVLKSNLTTAFEGYISSAICLFDRASETISVILTYIEISVLRVYIFATYSPKIKGVSNCYYS